MLPAPAQSLNRGEVLPLGSDPRLFCKGSGFPLTFSIILAIGMGIFLSAGRLGAETNQKKPEIVKLGIYMEGVGDFNEKQNSFRSEFWIWALTSPGLGNRITTLEFPKSLSIKREYQKSRETANAVWFCEKVTIVECEDWKRKNFPFDKHELEIVMEESEKDASEIQFSVDNSASDASQASLPPGWRIAKMELEPFVKKFKTSFGDPAIPVGSGSEYAGMKVKISLERISTAIFWKFTMVPYVAAILCLLAFVIPLDNIFLMAKFSLLIGTLLSVVLCMASASTAIGADNVFTLIDKIHMASLLYILMGVFCAVLSRWLSDIKIETSKLIRWNFTVGFSGFIALICVNFSLLYKAMH